MNIKYNNSMFTTNVPDLEEPPYDEDPEELLFQDQLERHFNEEDSYKHEIELIANENDK